MTPGFVPPFNVVDMLMVEHASLRLHSQFAKKTVDWGSIYDVEEFVRKSHAKVEDEWSFPVSETWRAMMKFSKRSQDLKQTTSSSTR